MIGRRRRFAIGAAFGLAAAAFAIGVSLGAGSPPDSHQLRRLTGSRPLPGLRALSLSRLAGERIILGFEGTTIPDSARRALRQGVASGVVLYADNFPSRAVARRLIGELQSIRRPPGLRVPLLVMIDQEGGLVKRISGAPSASAKEMGRRGPAFSREQGLRTGRNLRSLGINVDLAPVLDLGRPGGDIADTYRAFGSTPARVAATGVPFAEGLQRAGVAATAKHFPGVGALRTNTDVGTQSIPLSRRALRARDEAPFRRYVSVGGDMVMLSTAVYPAFSPKPAAFARPVATGELRGRLGFEGVSVTDALDTGAVGAFGGSVPAALAAARAGVDLLQFTDPGPAASAQRALLGALRAGTLSRSEFEASVERVLALRESLG
jgi:beta-N-acetylhexosaminidase